MMMTPRKSARKTPMRMMNKKEKGLVLNELSLFY